MYIYIYTYRYTHVLSRRSQGRVSQLQFAQLQIEGLKSHVGIHSKAMINRISCKHSIAMHSCIHEYMFMYAQSAYKEFRFQRV